MQRVSTITFYLAALPIPLLLVAMAILWVVEPAAIYESQQLLAISSFVFSTLASLVVVLLFGRTFLLHGTREMLVIGCGVLIWGAAGTIGPLLLEQSDNAAISIHNILMLISSLVIFTGAIIAVRKSSPEASRRLLLGSGIVVTIAVTWGVVLLVLHDITPIFFVQGQGGTAVRAVVLCLATALFAVTSAILMKSGTGSAPVFFRWFSLGLLLVSTGQFGLLLQTAHGTPVNWTARLAQLLGGAYFMVAAFLSLRTSHDGNITYTVDREWWDQYVRRMLQIGTVARTFLRYGIAVAAVMLACALRYVIERQIGPGLPPYITFYPFITLALLLGSGPGIAATFLSTGIAVVYILPPLGTVAVSSHVERFGLVLFIGMNLFLCALAEAAHRYRAKAMAFDSYEAVRENRERMAAFAEATFEGIVESEEGRIIDCNEQLACMLGYGVHEMKGMAISDIIVPEDRERIMANIRDGRDSVAEHGMFRKDGVRIVVEVHGRSMAAGGRRRITAIRDISDRKREEEMLRREHDTLQSVMNGAKNMHLVYLDSEFNFVRVNEVYAATCGYLPEEMIGKNHFALYPHQENESIFAHVRDTGEPYEVRDKPFEFPDQPERGVTYWDWTLTPVHGPEGVVAGLVLSLHETTERKLAELLLERDLDAMTRLRRLGMMIVEKGNIEPILDEILDTAIAIDSADFGNIQLFDPVSGHLRIVAQRGFPQWWLDFWASVAEGHGCCGTALERGERIIIEDVEQSPVFVNTPALEVQHRAGVCAVQSTPLVSRTGKPVGMFSTHHRTPSRPDDRTERLLDLLARQAADIIEQKQAEEALRISLQRLDLLAETAGKLLRSESPQQLVESLCQKVMSFLDCQAFFNFLADDATGRLHLNAYAGIPGDEAKKIEWLDYGVAVCGCVARDGCRIVVEDISCSIDPATELVKSYGIMAYACHPLMVGDKVLGTLSFGTRTRISFSDDDLSLMKTVADHVAIAMDRKKAAMALQHAHNVLEEKVAARTLELASAVNILEKEARERLKAEDQLREETTERIRAIEALRSQEQMMILQSRQAAMGEMIGNIAHQWRQPLNTLGLFTQRIGFFYGSPSFTREFLDASIAKSMEIIGYMSQTIDDFRNFFTSDREKSEFATGNAVDKALSLVEASFRENRIIVERGESTDTMVFGYPNEYSQVLLNILINAKDALMERKVPQPRVKVSHGEENGMSVVTIADNAGGIPEEIIDKIFTPYFTTKGPQQGTGIGLFMSKTIIEKNMGGKLSVRNSAEGAEFRIEV